jgi:hypothetical protein
MIYKKLSKKSKYIMVGVFVISVAFTLVYNNLFDSPSNCQDFQRFLKESYNGRVQNKFYNHKNDNSKTITILRNGNPFDIVIPTDTLVFSFIKNGDSLVKKQNQDFIEVHRLNTTTQFKVNFDCETQSP